MGETEIVQVPVVTGTGQETQPQADAIPAGDHFAARINVAALRQALGALAPLADEARLTVTPEGFAARVVDPAHVAMVELSVPRSAFAEIQGAATVGLDVEGALQALKAFNPKDAVSVEAHGDKVTLRQGRMARTRSLADASGIVVPPGFPKLGELPAQAAFNVAEARKALKAFGDVSDHVAVTVKDGALSMSAEGDTARDAWDSDLPAQGDARSLYSMDYFESILKAAQEIADTGTLSFGTDYPCRFEVEGPSGIRATYMLAPRIESE